MEIHQSITEKNRRHRNSCDTSLEMSHTDDSNEISQHYGIDKYENIMEYYQTA